MFLSAFVARFGKTEGKVRRLVAKDRQTGNIKDLPRSDRSKVTTEREDRFIVHHIRRHRFKPSRQTREDLKGVLCME